MDDTQHRDVDMREALYNDRQTGPVTSIQLPVERITRLHGILFDFDPKLLVPDNVLFPPADTPEALYRGIRPVLERHALARSAEVRSSGTGLHVIVWLDPAVELQAESDQEHWNAVVKAVQSTLPADPDAPGMTALTRPVGSVNGKNGATVRVLKTGVAIKPAAVLEYLNGLLNLPFKGVVEPLIGGDRISPCPVCRKQGTRLDVLDNAGKCYNGCSTVHLEDVYDCMLKPIETAVDAKSTVAAVSDQAQMDADQARSVAQEPSLFECISSSVSLN
jgi:hypothetical protein